MRLDIDKYVQYWSGHRTKLQIYEGGREAAVLIPLIQQDDGEIAILFEVRSAILRTQPSEICFPGDRYGKYVIWGATARILKSFLGRVKEIVAEETV